MTKEQIRTKFDRWAERVGHTPFENDLDNAVLLLSYDDKQTSTTLSTVAVYAVAVHTDHVHVFLFSVRTVWQLDAQDDTGEVLDERYSKKLSNAEKRQKTREKPDFFPSLVRTRSPVRIWLAAPRRTLQRCRVLFCLCFERSCRQKSIRQYIIFEEKRPFCAYS